MKLLNVLLIVFFPLTQISCANYQISDYKACVTLPYSGDGYCKHVLSNQTVIIPEAEWRRTPTIEFTSEDYKLLRRDILENCFNEQCKQIRGQLDAFFLRMDETLQRIPIL